MAIERYSITATNADIVAAGSLIPDSVPGWSEELLGPFDPDGARALLEEAGILDDLPGLRIQAGYEEPILAIMREGLIDVRSEERRAGKECRCRCWSWWCIQIGVKR